MTAIGKARPKKASTKPHGAMVPSPPALIARAARVEELRQMVTSGDYKVEPHKLAMKMLVRALRRPG